MFANIENSVAVLENAIEYDYGGERADLRRRLEIHFSRLFELPYRVSRITDAEDILKNVTRTRTRCIWSI